MITVKRLTLEDARIILEAAEAKAKEIGVAETICVCDDGGHPIALHRMTGARLTGVEIAIAKAFTAAGHRRATHKFNAPPGGPALPGNEAFGIHAMHPGKFAIFVGGFPIEVEGEVVGGIGVSGGNGEQDTQVGEAGIAALLRSLSASRRLKRAHLLSLAPSAAALRRSETTASSDGPCRGAPPRIWTLLSRLLAARRATTPTVAARLPAACAMMQGQRLPVRS